MGGEGLAPDSLTPAMIIDNETFTEMALRLKRASEATLVAAHHLAVLSNEDVGSEEHWVGALDSVMAMNTEVCLIEKMLRAVIDANVDEALAPRLVS
jgi:hypothetical protein